jgi:hypothetical protein
VKYHSYLKPIHLSFNFIPISQFTIHLVNALLNGLQNHSESIILSNFDFNKCKYIHYIFIIDPYFPLIYPNKLIFTFQLAHSITK